VNFKTLREKERALLQDLDTVRAAMRLLGEDAAGSNKKTGRKKRKPLSAATKARMSRSAKKRWRARTEKTDA